jgi:hypothetical protein
VGKGDRDGKEVDGGMGNGTTVQAYVGARNSGLWTFVWAGVVSENRVNEPEC